MGRQVLRLEEAVIVGVGREYEEYMAKFREENPGPWVQCSICRNWRMTTDKDSKCVLCPPKPRTRKNQQQWARRGAGDDQGHVTGPYGH